MARTRWSRRGPTRGINPDDTHLLLVTFYEGRIAGEWRIQNAVDVPVVGNVGLPEWGAKAGQAVGAVKELGSVPRSGAGRRRGNAGVGF